MKATEEIKTAYADFIAASLVAKEANDAKHKAKRALLELVGEESVDGLFHNQPLGDYVSDLDLADQYPDVYDELAKPKAGRRIRPA